MKHMLNTLNISEFIKTHGSESRGQEAQNARPQN